MKNSGKILARVFLVINFQNTFSIPLLNYSKALFSLLGLYLLQILKLKNPM